MPKDLFRAEVKKFLKNKNGKVAKIKYDMRTLNCAKEWYRFRNPLRMLWTSFIVEICRKLPPSEFKNNLYRMIGVKIGKEVTISPDVIIDWLFPELITIEDGVLIGGDMIIAAHEITIDTLIIGRIRIKKQALVASWVTVDPGITVGERSIIGLFSYVRHDVPAYSFVAGIPAKVIKMLDRKTYLADKKPKVTSEIEYFDKKEN